MPRGPRRTRSGPHDWSREMRGPDPAGRWANQIAPNRSLTSPGRRSVFLGGDEPSGRGPEARPVPALRGVPDARRTRAGDRMRARRVAGHGAETVTSRRGRRRADSWASSGGSSWSRRRDRGQVPHAGAGSGRIRGDGVAWYRGSAAGRVSGPRVGLVSGGRRRGVSDGGPGRDHRAGRLPAAGPTGAALATGTARRRSQTTRMMYLAQAMAPAEVEPAPGAVAAGHDATA